MKRSSKAKALTELIAPAVAACDVALWGVDFRPQGKRSVLRIYIDLNEKQRLASDNPNTASVGVDDCKRVSHQVSGLLDVHDPIAGEYVLEVSSPGWDRQFFELEQLRTFIGSTLAIRLITAVDNRRKLTATLLAVHDDRIDVSIPDISESLTLYASNIDKASLIFDG